MHTFLWDCAQVYLRAFIGTSGEKKNWFWPSIKIRLNTLLPQSISSCLDSLLLLQNFQHAVHEHVHFGSARSGMKEVARTVLSKLYCKAMTESRQWPYRYHLLTCTAMIYRLSWFSWWLCWLSLTSYHVCISCSSNLSEVFVDMFS